jgi:hypothetical protein
MRVLYGEHPNFGFSKDGTNDRMWNDDDELIASLPRFGAVGAIGALVWSTQWLLQQVQRAPGVGCNVVSAGKGASRLLGVKGAKDANDVKDDDDHHTYSLPPASSSPPECCMIPTTEGGSDVKTAVVGEARSSKLELRTWPAGGISKILDTSSSGQNDTKCIFVLSLAAEKQAFDVPTSYDEETELKSIV